MSVERLAVNVTDAIHIDPQRVLDGALRKGLELVVVVGLDGGGELYVAASEGTPHTVLLLEQAKAWIVAGCPGD